MKNLLLFPLILLLFTATQIKAETVHVTGSYVDKKNNPIAAADVEYYLYGNLLAASTLTSQNGSFSLEITFTGLQPLEAGNNEFNLSQNKPNPFSAETWFGAVVPEAGSLSIYSMTGVEIAHLDLVRGGSYQLKWGGLDRNGSKVPTGIYLYTLTSSGRMISNKMTVMRGDETGSSLEILSFANGKNILKNSWNSLTNDILRFTKSNATQLELAFPTPAIDTVLGNVTGNVGPNRTGLLAAQVNMHNLPQWNLNDYFYNDDQNVYGVDDTANFTIVSDTLLVFSGALPGQYEPQIMAVDPFDPVLTASMTAAITVSNEQDITITGIYLDKIGSPIAAADVSYYRQGSLLMGQTNTASDGAFSFTITTNGTTADTLKFQKRNTSLKLLGVVTPESDTTLGMIIGNRGPGNTGNINETHFTIEDTVRWNLNAFFTNDDQSIFSVTGNHFAVSDTNLIFTRLIPRNYLATVTATDPQDPTLTATMNVNNTIVKTMVIPDLTIPEDTATGVLIPDLNVYKNPGYPGALTYSVISQSNPALLSVLLNGSALNLSYLQVDGNGTSQIGIIMVNGSLADTCYFNIIVQPRSDVSGYVKDIFTNAVIALAKVRFNFNNFHDSVYTNTSGFYKIQLPSISSKFYIAAAISKPTYTTFHTWVTKSNNTDTIKDFNLIPLTSPTWSWDLYNRGFRRYTDISMNPGYGNTTVWWLNPPIEDAFSDNSLVGGQNIVANFNNLLTNLNTILPTFNAVESLPANIVQHTSFVGYTLTTGHMMIYFDNSITGIGNIGCTYSSAATFSTCEVIFKSGVGCNTGCSAPGSDNWVFNQELGSGMGACREPSAGSYTSVFTDPPPVNTYTSYDFSASTVRLGRTRAHYRNSTYAETDPEGHDWELRPDIPTKMMDKQISQDKSKLKFMTKTIFENGSSKYETYDYNKVPSSVMKQFRFMFTKEEVEQREREEANCYRK